LQWDSFAQPGEVFKFLKSNHVCLLIDMGDLPPLDIIHELANIALKLKGKTSTKAFQELSDLVSILVASSFKEVRPMINELIIRDQLGLLENAIDELLTNSSYENEGGES